MENNKENISSETNIILDIDKKVFNKYVKNCSKNNLYINFIRNKFKRLTKKASKKLINILMKNQENIFISDLTDKWKGFYQYNKSKFQKNNTSIQLKIQRNIETKK